jgi:dynein heavy chain
MESVFKNPNVLACCVRGDASNRLEELRILQSELDKCEKSLIQYLEGKRMALPRFYFIPNEDLLEILGTSDPQAIQPHLQKLYDDCERLQFGQGGKVISHMWSQDDEAYEFDTYIKPENNIEEWMLKVEEEMKKTLHIRAKTGVFNYAKHDRIEWMEKQLCMIALVGSQIWWTFAIEDVFKRIMERGEAKAMKEELSREN